MPQLKRLWNPPAIGILLICALLILFVSTHTALGGESLVSADLIGGPFAYTGSPITPTVTLLANGSPVAESYYSLIYEDHVEPGTGKITITYTNVPVLGAGGAPAAESGVITKTFSIVKAPVTVDFSASPSELTYNGTIQSIPFSLTGEITSGAAGAYAVYSGTDTQPKNAGSYTTAISISDETHYELIGETSFPFTIRPAPVTVVFPAADPGYTYNGQVQGPPYSVTDPVAGEDPIVQVTYTKGGAQVQPKNAGSYTANAALTGDIINANYQMIPSTFSFAIRPKYLSIKALPSGKPLGTIDPTPIAAYEMAGQAAGETPLLTGKLERRSGEAVGDYPILIGSLALDTAYPINSNYILGFESGGMFTITELTGAPDAALSPAAPDGKNGFYASRVRILAPEGFQIGKSQLNADASWHSALENDDGIDISTGYYLRRNSDGGITKMLQAPLYSQDTKIPDVASEHTVSTLGKRPLLMFTADDDIHLDRIEVLLDGKTIYTMRPKEKSATWLSYGYPLTLPGVYNGVAYDAAGNRALETIEIIVKDTDGDGLTDLWEENIGTDIYKTDSDGDGIDDRAAVYLSIALLDDFQLPAIIGLMAGVPGNSGTPDNILESPLFESLADARVEDAKSAPRLDSSAAIVQYDSKAGSGWALIGSRLVRFTQNAGKFVPVEVITLNGSFGATRLVALASGDGSIFLLANWNESLGAVSGEIQLLDTRTGRLSTITGTDGATAFDISVDGTMIAYRALGTIHVLNLVKGSIKTIHTDAKTLTFTPGGGLALGGQDDTVRLYIDDSIIDTAYLGLVDMAQRTNTSRTVTVFTKAGQAPVAISGKLTFSLDASAIVFDGGEHVAVVTSAQE